MSRPPADVIQRTLDVEPDGWEDLLRGGTASLQKLTEIEQSQNVSLTVFEMETLQGGASGWTYAVLTRSDGREVRIRTAGELAAVKKEDLADMAKLDIVITVAQRAGSHADEALVDRDDSGTVMTLLHELERHAIPFYDLYMNAQLARFDAELGDPGGLDALAADVASPAGRFTATAQHESPDLNAKTVEGVLKHLEANGNEQLNRRTLFRLALDTTKHGAGFQETAARVPLLVRQKPLFGAFQTVATKVATATPGSMVEQPAPGMRVMVMDGFYMGCEGVITDDRLPPEYADAESDFIVRIQGTSTVVEYPKSWCLFLT